jgi:hypothetical protein
MMRAGRDYVTKDGGFVIPADAVIIIDGKRLTAREFLESKFSAGRIVRQPDGELAIETFKPES